VTFAAGAGKRASNKTATGGAVLRHPVLTSKSVSPLRDLTTKTKARRYVRMDDESQISALSRRSRGLLTQMESARPQDQVVLDVTIEQRWASERRRTHALKMMRLAKAAAWRRFLRRRLPSNA
jgi:hypothetical protein